jgi:hypothetical protein
MNWCEIILLILLIIIFGFVFYIYTINKKSNENFENCFKMQYYGIPLLQNPNNPLCSKNTTEPLYKEGGCAEYDLSNIQANYIDGKYRSAV